MAENRSRTFRKVSLLTACVLCGALVLEVSADSAPSQQERINHAIEAGVAFLLTQISQDGSVEGERPPDDQRHGEYTAATVYALLSAGVDPKMSELQRSIAWLVKAEPNGTFARAFRACALAEWNDPRALEVLKRDVDWLVQAAGADGAYSYGSQAAEKTSIYDNANSQAAVLGLWAASNRGINAPVEFWTKVENHWRNEQQPDGGWGYRALPLPRRTRTYGSMTAAGLASLFVTFDILHRSDFVRIGTNAEYEPISDGLTWLGKNFAIEANPRMGALKHYWLFSLQRVALASGYKYFGEHDWYAEGAAELIATQDTDGSWGFIEAVPNTAFALQFLVRGRYPVLINKLKYPGRWNSRPRDIANLVRWLSWSFERPVSWQVIDVNSPLADWHDAPILYISGAGACEFSKQQIEKLRTYAMQGGLILSEAAGNNGDFTLDMQALYRELVPGMPLRRVADDDPIYTLHFTPAGVGGLLGLSNGVRYLAMHSPRELSLGLQLGASEDDRARFELMGNMHLLATDKGRLPPRGTTRWPASIQFAPAGTVSVARLKYGGNYDPEPLAWKRLATIIGNRYGIKLEVGEPLPITELDAQVHRLAVMTGTEAFELSKQEVDALKEYFRAGGTLVIDAAGGSRAFNEAVYEQILNLPDNPAYGPIASDHPIYSSPELIEKVTYRHQLSLTLGRNRNRPRLRGVLSNGRLAIIYSREDLTAGLVGYQRHGISGYAPESATNLMINIICNVAGISPTATAASTLP